MYMADLTHLFKVGQKVRWRTEGKLLDGVVKEVTEDHVIVDVPEVSDHCYFEEGTNLCDLFPEYNFEVGKEE